MRSALRDKCVVFQNLRARQKPTLRIIGNLGIRPVTRWGFGCCPCNGHIVYTRRADGGRIERRWYRIGSLPCCGYLFCGRGRRNISDIASYVIVILTSVIFYGIFVPKRGTYTACRTRIVDKIILDIRRKLLDKGKSAPISRAVDIVPIKIIIGVCYARPAYKEKYLARTRI